MRTLPHAFLREARGGASVELALGAVVLLGIATLCFDLYARVSAETASMRVAATMADYVSRDTETKGPDLVALGEFLHAHELGIPADLVYVISALRRQSAADAPPEVEVLWSSADIRIGDDLEELADDCSRYVDCGGQRGAARGLRGRHEGGRGDGRGGGLRTPSPGRLADRPLHRWRHLPGPRPAGTRSGCAPFHPGVHDAKRCRSHPPPGPNLDSRRVWLALGARPCPRREDLSIPRSTPMPRLSRRKRRELPREFPRRVALSTTRSGTGPEMTLS